LAQPPAPPQNPPRHLEVEAKSRLSIAPDVVDLNLGLLEEADRPKKAVDALKKKRDALVKSLLDAGLPKSDLNLSFISLQPRYRTSKSIGGDYNRYIDGYRASMSFVACLRDPSKLDIFVEKAAEVGISSITTQFRVLDIPKHRIKLRKMALEAAARKANEIATTLGVKIASVLQVKELPHNTWGAQNVQSFSYQRSGGGRDQSVSPDAIKLELSVRILYSIRD
jgi:uncharacterized protein YggE